MLVRIGPNGVVRPGRTLHITENMLHLPQPVTFTCIASNQVETTNHQKRMYRRAAKIYEVRSNITFTVGKYTLTSNDFLSERHLKKKNYEMEFIELP